LSCFPVASVISSAPGALAARGQSTWRFAHADQRRAEVIGSFRSRGEVRPVAYSIADFVAQRPRSTDLTIAASNSLGGLLRQFQGAAVRIESAGAAVEGRIVSVNVKQVAVAARIRFSVANR
jgi:hypothetical protein